MRMKKLEKLIKEKCDVPIVSIRAYKPERLSYMNIEIITEFKFAMGNSVSPKLLEDMGIEETAKLISEIMSEEFKEKMKLANIKKLKFEIY